MKFMKVLFSTNQVIAVELYEKYFRRSKKHPIELKSVVFY